MSMQCKRIRLVIHFGNRVIFFYLQEMYRSNIDHLQLEVKVKINYLSLTIYRLQKQWLLRESTTTGCHIYNSSKMAKNRGG